MSGTEIDNLISEISKLPGLGRKSAQRIALHLLKNKERSLLPLIQIMKVANHKIIICHKNTFLVKKIRSQLIKFKFNNINIYQITHI